ncbi:MAG: hypothetical protein GY858_00930 [Candidatus Omnitrophica bacterium]|nr:hypothetical protein [Candidatus Omnitrophota bacterium]
MAYDKVKGLEGDAFDQIITKNSIFRILLVLTLILQTAFLPVADIIPKVVSDSGFKLATGGEVLKCISNFIMPDAFGDIFAPPEGAVSGAMSAGNLSQSFSADLFTGKASCAYPIAVVPGRKGVQPNLSLSYSSQVSNTWCGLGWNLGVASIYRASNQGIPQYDSSDVFIFSVSGTESVLIPIGGDQYRVQTESGFSKFYYTGSCWEISDKAGTVYRLGYNSDSKVVNAKGTYRWSLDKVTDLNGNYMSVAYTHDQGTLYPSQIKYTGNETTSDLPLCQVDFTLESRDDAPSSYRSGVKTYLAYRLKEITTRVDGALDKKYTLDYTYSAQTQRSLLTSITQYGSDGVTSLPSTTFTYSQDDYAITPSSLWLDSHSSDYPLTGDFNGDSVTDVGFIYSDQAYVALSNENGFNAPVQTPGQWGSLTDVITGDFNGDGLTDITKREVTDITTANIGGDTSHSDSFVDIITYTLSVALSNGESFTYNSWRDSMKAMFFSGEEWFYLAGDFNGDGLSDVIEWKTHPAGYFPGWCYTYLSNGSTFVADDWWGNEGFNQSLDWFTGDFNGDGLTDIGGYDNGTWQVALSTGEEFTSLTTWKTGFGNGDQALAVDVNSDGLTDAVTFNESTGNWEVAISNGQEFLAPQNWLTNLGQGKLPLCGDYNGNGINAPGFFDKANGTWHIAQNQGTVYDLLTRVDNGLGGATAITYQPSPHNTDFPFTIQTVESITTHDGLGNSFTTTYEFFDGYHDREKRQFRGFNCAKVTDPDGNYSETYFKQDDIYKGRPYLTQTKDSSGNLFTKQESTYNYTNPQTNVTFVYLESQDSFIYDGDATFKQTRTSYTYDDYGNPLTVTSLGDVAVSGDEKTLITEYTYNTADWLLSFPKHTYVQDDLNNTISEKWFYYDEATSINTTPVKGALTKQEISHYNSITSVNERLATQYTYDAYGNLISTTNPNNKTTTTTYDNFIHAYPISVTNSLGQSVSSTYNYKTGQVLTTTDTNNQTTSNDYDVFGRLEKVFGPLDGSSYPGVSYLYDLTVQPVKIRKHVKKNHIGAPEYMTSYSFYDGLGRLIQNKTPAENDGAQARQIISGTVRLDSRGQVSEKYFPYFANSSQDYVAPTYAQKKTTYTYDAMGRVTQTTNPDSTYSTTNYSDWTVTATNEGGHFKTTYFDAYGNVTKVEEHNQGATYTTLYEYDNQSNLTKVTDNQGNITQITYDSLGRKIKMDDPDMGIWFYEYDDVGNLIKQTDTKSQVLEFEYDDINRLTRKFTASTTLASYTYDDDAKDYCEGRLSKVADQSGSTDFYYDVLGREIKSTKVITGSGTYTVERTYDALDRIKTLKYPDGETVTYTYNEGGGIETVAGNDNYITDIDYSQTNQIDTIAYGNNTTTDYTYNANTLRLSNITTQNQTLTLQNLSYSFDSVGNVTVITDAINTGTQSFSYDDLNRLTQAIGTSYGTLNYAYDSIGNMIDKDGLILTYGGGAAGPHAITGYGSTAITYDGNGNMSAKGAKNYSYDIENRLTQVEGGSFSGNSTQTLTLQEGWNFISLPVIPGSLAIEDILESIEGKYDQVSQYNPTTDEFEHYVANSTYDHFSSLEYAKGYQIYITDSNGVSLDITGTAPESITKSLSANWNLIGALSDDAAVTTILDGIDFDTLARYNETSDTLEEYPGSFSELEAGRAYYLQTDTAQSLNVSSNTTTAFVYDGDGGRVIKQTTDQSQQTTGKTVYVGSLYEIHTDSQSNTTIKKHIFAGSNKVCTVEPSETYYYHSDHLGSSNVITDSNGDEVATYEYKPYGQSSAQTGTDVTNYNFTGKELDETGLYYYSARYYDAQLGRFITADTIVPEPYNPQSLNRYSYCYNNPIKYTDPSGHWAFIPFIIGMVKAAVVGATIGAATAAVTGGDIGKGALFGAIGGAVFAGFSSLAQAGMRFATVPGGIGPMTQCVTITSNILGAAVGGFAGGTVAALAGGASSRDAVRIGGRAAAFSAAAATAVEVVSYALRKLTQVEETAHAMEDKVGVEVPVGAQGGASKSSLMADIGEVVSGEQALSLNSNDANMEYQLWREVTLEKKGCIGFFHPKGNSWNATIIKTPSQRVHILYEYKLYPTGMVHTGARDPIVDVCYKNVPPFSGDWYRKTTIEYKYDYPKN